LALSRQCARGGAVDRGKVAAWAAENNPKSDGAPEMIIAARRTIRQLRHHVGAAVSALVPRLERPEQGVVVEPVRPVVAVQIKIGLQIRTRPAAEVVAR
jgi:hypothetical protein